MSAANLVTASTVADVHDWFSWVVIFSNALAGLWALAAHRRPSLRSIGLWVTTATAQTMGSGYSQI